MLNRREDDLSTVQYEMLAATIQNDPTPVNKTVLVVDDDLRSFFAFTRLLTARPSLVLAPVIVC
jgi:hypothetical protein